MAERKRIAGDGCPAHMMTGPVTNRRGLLLGLGAGGAAALAGCPALAQGTPAAPNPAQAGAGVADAPAANAAESRQFVPFRGIHQAGVATPRPANGIVASFDTALTTPAELEAMLRRLTDRIAHLTGGGDVPVLDPRLPPADSGLLGDKIMPDNLTITVGLGRSLFDKHDWMAGLAPNSLIRMEQFPNDALRRDLCHGDLSLQFCANLQDTNIHALRDIVKNMRDFLVLRWMQAGAVPPELPPPDGSRAPSARNYLGFRDGSANPDTSDPALMDRLVWATKAEPEWAAGGTYQVVRIIRNFVERWDRTPLREQEAIFGRTKMGGEPLAGGHEYQDFDYASDPDGKVTPLDAHIRLANPRTGGDLPFIRRAFNYSNGVEKNGQIDQGLLFISYQNDLNNGFIAIQNRLNGEPLEEYIKPVGGGYFFVLPGARDGDDYLGRTLVEALPRAANET